MNEEELFILEVINLKAALASRLIQCPHPEQFVVESNTCVLPDCMLGQPHIETTKYCSLCEKTFYKAVNSWCKYKGPKIDANFPSA